MEDRGGRGGVLEVGLDSGAGEAGLSHDPADAGVIEDRDDELLELDSDGEERLLLVLVELVRMLVGAAAALVGLSALESGDEGVGERGLAVEERAGSGGEAVEGDVEAELKSAALEAWDALRLRLRLRVEASPSQEAGSGAEKSCGHVEGSDLSMASPPRQPQRVLQNRSSLRCEGLL